MRGPRRPWLWLLVPAVLVVAGIAWLHMRFPDALSTRDSRVDLAHTLLILAFVGGSLILHRRIPRGHALRHVAVWLAVALVVFAAYAYRHEMRAVGARLYAELVPSAGVSRNGGEVRFPASAGGHFIVEATVDGTPVRFLVDTGASDVVLSPSDAERLGFDPARLDYTKTYRTANGTVRGAPVRLQRVRIGPITVDDIRASVNEAPMGRSLLGMRFLERLGGYSVEDGALVLRQ